MRSFIEAKKGPMTDEEFDIFVDTRFTKPADFLKDVRQEMFDELSQRAETITRYEFQLWIQGWIERVMNDGNDGNDDWLVLSTDVKHAENITDIWPENHIAPLPKLKVVASYKRRVLPEDLIRVGGKPKWIQGDETPLCPSGCDSFMCS